MAAHRAFRIGIVSASLLAALAALFVPAFLPRLLPEQAPSSAARYDSLKRLTAEKRFAAALPLARQALAEHPREEGFAVYALWCLRELKRFDEAIALGRRALKDWPTSEHLRTSLAWALTGQAARMVEEQLPGDPVPFAREGHDLHPADGTALWLGISLRQAKRLDEAARVLADGVRRYPDNPHFKPNLMYTWLELGQRARDAGDRSGAEDFFAKSYQLDSNNESALLWHAIALRERKNHAEANRLFAEGMRRFPGNRYFAENLRWSAVEEAQALTDRDEVVRARALLEALRSSLPRDPFVISALAQTYFRRDHARWAALSRESLALVPPEKLKARNVYQCPLRAPRIMVHQGNLEPVTHLGIGAGYGFDLVLVDEKNAYGPAGERKEDHLVFGAPVYAALEGTVTQVYDASPDTEPNRNGPHEVNRIMIVHEGKEYSYYAHLKKGSALVKTGERVRTGQRIALVGSSGRYVDFPHLHFQVMRDDICVEARLTGLELFGAGGWRNHGALVPKKGDLLRSAW